MYFKSRVYHLTEGRKVRLGACGPSMGYLSSMPEATESRNQNPAFEAAFRPYKWPGSWKNKLVDVNASAVCPRGTFLLGEFCRFLQQV